MEQFNPSLRTFIAMGKNYEKALAGKAAAGGVSGHCSGGRVRVPTGPRRQDRPVRSVWEPEEGAQSGGPSGCSGPLV